VEFETKTRPLLASGFEGSHRVLLGDYFEWLNGQAKLTKKDESTTTRGLFLAGMIFQLLNPRRSKVLH
jgi:hypothetical protein